VTLKSPFVPEEHPRGEALSKLFEAHNRALHTFLMARLRNDQEAHKVAQEAYVRLLQLNQPGAVSFLRAYLFKTAANIAVDRIRQRAARARLDGAPEQEPIDGLMSGFSVSVRTTVLPDGSRVEIGAKSSVATGRCASALSGRHSTFVVPVYGS
jgi:DNA-directed RNA polymerase specialized sigma24 family protein